jgi:DNA-binding NtrC family response regulator
MPRPVARVELKSRAAPPARAELSVLLVDPDRVGRASLARAFVRVRWAVTVVDSIEDLDDALSGSARIDVAIVDVRHALAEPIASAIVAALPGVLLVVRSADAGRARSLIAATGAQRSELRLRDAPPEELIEAVRRALDA